MKMLSGMFAAIPTPFCRDNTINTDSLKAICEDIVSSGMQGILVCGSTGEYSLMTADERKVAVKTVVDAVNGRTKVIAGCSCHYQSDTIAMVQAAEELGADMALILPPYYMQTTEDGIYQYYKAICESIQTIGIVIYNYPFATGVELSVELIKKLSTLPHMAGVKNTTEMEHTSKLIGAMKDNNTFGVINGFEHLVMGTLTSGGDGTMGIIHALAPNQMMTIYNAVQAGDLKTAMEMNDRMRTLYTLMEQEPCPGPVKAALTMKGMEFGVPRRPLLPASEEIKASLKDEMEKINLI